MHVPHEEIHREARRRFMDFVNRPPATGEMWDYPHFVAEVAYEMGYKRGEDHVLSFANESICT